MMSVAATTAAAEAEAGTHVLAPLADGPVDLLDGLPEDQVLAVDGEVERRVEDDEEVIDDDDVLGPQREVARVVAAALDVQGHLVQGDEDLADVAHKEEDDDADQHHRDGAVAPLAGVLLERDGESVGSRSEVFN